MKIVVSPAKTLDYESKLPTNKATKPHFIDEAETLNKKLERKTKIKFKVTILLSFSTCKKNVKCAKLQMACYSGADFMYEKNTRCFSFTRGPPKPIDE